MTTALQVILLWITERLHPCASACLPPLARVHCLSISPSRSRAFHSKGMGGSPNARRIPQSPLQPPTEGEITLSLMRVNFSVVWAGPSNRLLLKERLHYQHGCCIPYTPDAVPCQDMSKCQDAYSLQPGTCQLAFHPNHQTSLQSHMVSHRMHSTLSLAHSLPVIGNTLPLDLFGTCRFLFATGEAATRLATAADIGHDALPSSFP